MAWLQRTTQFICRHGLLSPSSARFMMNKDVSCRALHSNSAALDKARSETMAGRWHQGKLIVEETEDPTVYPHVLLRCHGYDECSLDTFMSFVKSSAKMIGIDVTKSFSMPADIETIKTVEGVGVHKKRQEHKLKTYKRVLQVVDLTAENSDIFLSHIKDGLPAGVTMKIELLQWEKFVAPDHPSFRSQT